MRIQIKVYLEAKDDMDCSGTKPDFWVSAKDVEAGVQALYDLVPVIAKKEEGIAEEEDETPETD
jgi:hypothetical protein